MIISEYIVTVTPLRGRPLRILTASSSPKEAKRIVGNFLLCPDSILKAKRTRVIYRSPRSSTRQRKP